MRLLLAVILLGQLTVGTAFCDDTVKSTDLYSSFLKGLLCVQNGQFEEGLKELEKAQSKDPKSVHIRLRIATILIRLERFQEAEDILREAKEINPDNLDLFLALIFIYSYERKDKELEAEYESFLKKAHELKPKDVGISEYLAQFYFYKKKPLEAIQIYKKILEINPEYVEAYFWIGYLLEELGQRAEAISAWREGLAKNDSFAPILNSLGYIYALTGENLQEAENMIRAAVAAEPENGAYLDSLGWIFYKKGDFAQAKEYLEKAISLIKDPEIYDHLGDLYIVLEDTEKAVSCYREGLTFFPEDKTLQEKLKKYGGASEESSK